ncbi:hypothetical protein [Arthrobacter sp. PM3]|uniref:hypothetical protein n=1 Tax=Arthrobacter sp. PM3 TaxID=2017685 RepID=UPI000E103695|nr:hypothetical protein [Arthrobacter sp. PM3]AXJ11239.1 hypothetical protein CFN17_17705 [Arthrobacter sp. PM3]
MMTKWWSQQRLLSRIFGVLALLGGVVALASMAALLFGSSWRWSLGTMSVSALLFGMAGTAAARCVILGINASRRELSATVKDLSVQLKDLRGVSSAAMETVENVQKTVRDHSSALSDLDGRLTRSLKTTSRNVTKLDATLQSLDLSQRLDQQAQALERSAFNVARSQRRMEFEVLKARGTAVDE